MDLLCIGELLVDRITLGSTVHSFFGGAPANVAVNYAQLGGEAAVIAKVGADSRGRFLLDGLKAHGVSAEGVVIDAQHQTSEVYIGSADTACRPMRDADVHLRPDEIDERLVRACRIVHTSVFSLAQEPSRSAILEAVRLAKANRRLVSLEPNYRSQVWPDHEEAIETLEQLLPSVDLVKPSVDDARSLYGEMAPEEYLRLFAVFGPRVVVLTIGQGGCLLLDGGRITGVPGHKVEVVDTLGAGDAFWAGFLWKWLEGESSVEAARFGNAVSALKVGSVGAVAPLPRADRVYDELQSRLKGSKEGSLHDFNAEE
jgi:sugar/nucleoside kinase (ribokinase family)